MEEKQTILGTYYKTTINGIAGWYTRAEVEGRSILPPKELLQAREEFIDLVKDQERKDAEIARLRKLAKDCENAGLLGAAFDNERMIRLIELGHIPSVKAGG